MNYSFLGIFLDWRWLAICSSIPPTLLMVCMCFMPETPRYLLSKGKRREAEEALRFLRGPDAPIEWECARIEDAYDEQVSLWLVRSNEQRKMLFIERKIPTDYVEGLLLQSKILKCLLSYPLIAFSVRAPVSRYPISRILVSTSLW